MHRVGNVDFRPLGRADASMRVQHCQLAAGTAASIGRIPRTQTDLRSCGVCPLHNRGGALVPGAIGHEGSFVDRRKFELQTTVRPDSVETELGSGGDEGGGDGSPGGGGDDGGESDGSGGGLSPGVAALLAQAGRSIESFSAEFSAAIASGKVTKEVLERYLALEAGAITGFLMNIAGFRERLLADPSFLYKVCLECGIGIFTKSAAEYGKRKGTFMRELDFVLANMIMAVFADFLLVWLPAPTLAYRATAAASKKVLFPWWSKLPDNAFQVVQPGMDRFTFFQRFGAILRNGAKLFGVGLVCSFTGVAITNALVWFREQLDPNFTNVNPPQDVFKTGGAYALYMAVSANLRYQIVAGIIEERAIEVVFKGRPQICKALSTVVRTGNTFIGSLLWVDFIRLLGMQKAPEPPPEPLTEAAQQLTAKDKQQ